MVKELLSTENRLCLLDMKASGSMDRGSAISIFAMHGSYKYPDMEREDLSYEMIACILDPSNRIEYALRSLFRLFSNRPSTFEAQ